MAIDVRLLNDHSQQRKVFHGQRVLPAEKGELEMYIVLDGKVGIHRLNAQNTLESAGFAGAGEPFGQREFFEGREGIFIAAQDSILYVITEASFDRLAQTRPRVLYALLAYVYRQQSPVPTPQSAIQALRQRYQASREDSASVTSVSDIYPKGHKGYPGVLKSEYEKFVYRKEYSCPNCAKLFSGYKIFLSKLVTAASQRYDMRKYYEDFQMEWYEVITCPHCYFSMFANLFSETGSFLKARIRDRLSAVKSGITLDFEKPRDIDFVFACHYLAAVCAAGYLSSKQINARIWSNLSWLYEDVDDQDMALYAAGQAAKAHEEVYMDSQLSPAQEQLVCLSIAGMQYRTGDIKDVKKWLFKAKTNKLGKKIYADQAENLMETLRQQGKPAEES